MEIWLPPAGNANFGWGPSIFSTISPNGLACFVLANGSMSSIKSGEGEIRKNIIEADWWTVWWRCRDNLLLNANSGLTVFIARGKKGAGSGIGGETLLSSPQAGTMIDRVTAN